MIYIPARRRQLILQPYSTTETSRDIYRVHRVHFNTKMRWLYGAFDARITALFYSKLPPAVERSHKDDVDYYIRSNARVSFLNWVEDIRESIFKVEDQYDPPPNSTQSFDWEYSAHASSSNRWKSTRP